MIELIIQAISIAIHGAFGDGYKIHANSIEQGLEEPCFLIVLINYTKEQLLGNRSIRRLPFDIHFFPSQGESQCWEVADKLMNALNIITTVDGEKFAGSSMDAEIVDGVLHFRVNFNFIASVSDVAMDKMEEINVASIKTEG